MRFPVRRSARLVPVLLSTALVRLLARLAPQRWCPPNLSLRLFRHSSEPSAAITAADVRAHLPSGGWITRRDLPYLPSAGRDGVFDLVVPDRPGPHPVILWVHGGGWHFGSKADVLPYLEHLAARGYAGAAINVPRAPRSRYPAAPAAVEGALSHLQAHAAAYDLDPTRVVLAGDSAGAQVAAEVAVGSTSPAFAARCGRTPALPPEHLRGTLLFCGIYDPPALDDSSRMFAAVLESAMWSLTGTRDWRSTEACTAMTVLDRATTDFPATFLAAGNADPLTRRQTAPFAARLAELGVEVEAFLPGDDTDPLHHEFQFRLGTAAGTEALDRAVRFLDRVTGISH